MTTTNIKSINFYSWEGDACRVIEYINGDVTADIYRGGKGLLTINPTDPMFNGSSISEKRYKELVQAEISLRKKHG